MLRQGQDQAPSAIPRLIPDGPTGFRIYDGFSSSLRQGQDQAPISTPRLLPDGPTGFKIKDGGNALDVINWPSAPLQQPTTSNYIKLSDEITTYGRSYDGPIEKCTFSFQSVAEQLGFIDDYMRNRALTAIKAAVAKEGGQICRMVVYRDHSPTWRTLYRVDLYADVRGESAMAMPFPWTSLVIIGLVALVAYFLVRPTVESVTDLFWGPADSGGGVPGITTPLLIGIAALVGLYLITRSKTKSIGGI